MMDASNAERRLRAPSITPRMERLIAIMSTIR